MTRARAKWVRHGRGRLRARAVDSSMLTHIAWDSRELLLLRFRKSGDVWCYNGVDRSTWLSLCRAKSKGKWFNRVLRQERIDEVQSMRLGPDMKAEVERLMGVSSE